MSSKDGIPDWLAARHGGRRAFKAKKRRALRSILAAFDDAVNGCAFMPGNSQRSLREAERLVESALEDCAVKKWGR